MSARKRTDGRVRPKLPVHAYAGTGVCCNLPRRNPVHDLTLLPTQTAEQKAAEARRYAETEEP